MSVVKHSCIQYSDYIQCLQIEVAAFDDTYPENLGKAVVQVKIIHNPNAPEFVLESYSASVYEYTTPGTEVITVSATDGDGVSVPIDILKQLVINCKE